MKYCVIKTLTIHKIFPTMTPSSTTPYERDASPHVVQVAQKSPGAGDLADPRQPSDQILRPAAGPAV